MLKLFQQVEDELRRFLRQRENFALVLCGSAGDALPILKVLEGLEEASASDLFWTCTENFADPRSYASAIIKNFATRHGVVRLAMEKQKMSPWLPIPSEILSEQEAPARRLRALAAFSRELLPVPNGGNNVWIFYPLEVRDNFAFATLIKELLAHEFPFPWCHHLRFIIREDPADHAIQRLIEKPTRIQWYEPDLSMAAINQSLESEIADENVPLAERIALLLVMAGNDYSQGRYPEALRKYELLLRYHAAINNHTMAAFALNGMGEVYERTGDLARANESFEAALIPASVGEHPPLPVFLNVLTNIGDLCMRQARWQDGESYYDMAQQIATAARNPSVKMKAIENRGICQQKQGKGSEAAQSWNDGAVIAAQLQDVHTCQTFLQHLEGHYRETGQSEKAGEVHKQLIELAKS
jgi:tetratricopeptide (TPR) repeat protein